MLGIREHTGEYGPPGCCRTCAVQLGEIREFAGRQGYGVVEAYGDIASGAREDRAEFRRLLADAARGKFEAVVVQRFGRAARSVRQLIETLEHLHRCRVAFVILKEDVDTSTPAAELIFHVMAALGQFERALIGDRIRSGLARARARGSAWVAGRPPFAQVRRWRSGTRACRSGPWHATSIVAGRRCIGAFATRGHPTRARPMPPNPARRPPRPRRRGDSPTTIDTRPASNSDRATSSSSRRRSVPRRRSRCSWSRTCPA
jgi:Resolvase, N terminal domain